jgi:hypothetical protein
MLIKHTDPSRRRSWRVLGLAIAIVLLTHCGDRPEKVAETKEMPEVSSRQGREVAVFEQSRYGGLLSGGGKTLLPASADERELARALLTKLRSEGLGGQAALSVLAEARVMETEAILEVIQALLASPEADIRAQALMMLDGAESGSVLPVLEKGLDDADLDVRRLAMELALTVQSPMVEKMVNQGLVDADETIRQTALQVGLRQGGALADRTLASGIASAHEDLGAASLALLENELNKARLPLALSALEHPAESVREDARDMLFFLFHERFPDRATAAAWWQQNQARYDPDLVLTEAVPAAR